MPPPDKNRFLIGLSESEHTDFGRVSFAQQNQAQKVFSAIWELESQVNNGGFDQYFRSSDTEEILYAPLALGAIGALRCRAIVETAFSVLGAMPLTQEGRAEALDALPQTSEQALDAADAEFFAYPDNLTELLFDFVSRRPETFGPIPATER